MYRLCDRAQPPAALLRQAGAVCDADLSWTEIEPAIEALCEARLLLRLNGKLLSLGQEHLREGA